MYYSLVSLYYYHSSGGTTSASQTRYSPMRDFIVCMFYEIYTCRDVMAQNIGDMFN